MKKKLLGLGILFTLLFSGNMSAQDSNIIRSLQQPVPGQGRVTIHQDPLITSLLGKERTSSEPIVVKSTGYRVQVFSGSNTNESKNQANSMAAKVKNYVPGVKIYTYFNPPRWLCQVGDFRTIEEADAMMRRLKSTGMFKEVSIVKEQVNVTF